MADVSKVTVSGTTYNIKDATARAGVMPFGVTAGGTTAYTVSISGVTLTVGTLITCKFNATNAANATLNVNSLGAVPIYYKGAKITASQITANYTVLLVYETSTLSTGCWTVIWSYGYDSNSNTVPSAYSTTAAATAAKVATATNYTLTANTYVHVLFQYANSVQDKITLNINSKGAKDIYINGTVSSSSNYTLPAGTYIAYYDGTGFQFRTDGKLPASISGDASTVGGHTVAVNVPSNAKFTDTTYSDATTSTHGLMSTTDKSKLDGIATGAEVNQNAFSNITVGSTTISADTKTDTLTLVAGSNVTITPDATNDKVTISSTNTTYSDATTSTHGLMSTSDKSKLDGIESGANKYSLPTASSSTLGGIKVGTNLSISSGVLSATDTKYSDVTTSAHGLMTASDKTKLDGIATGAEVNQNAFSNITVGSTTVSADTKTDTLTLVAGSNVTLTPDATNDKITIAATDTTYSDVTTSAHGLMTSSDKTKLDGIETGANKYTLPTASASVLGGVKVGTNLSISSGVLSATDTTYSDATTSTHGLMSTSDKAKLNGMAVNYYGVCDTAAATAAKTVTVDSSFSLVAGVVVGVKFANSNSASSPTLNVNSTGAKYIYLYGTTKASTTTSTTGWYAGSVVMLTYDGTGWIRDQGFNTNDNTYPSAYCSTADATAAKVASCSGYVLTSNTYLHLILTNANSSATAITLNVNSKGAKTIAINGTASSTTNYTLPAGSYLTYYDGTYYQIRTDGKIPGPGIVGDATTVGGHTVGVNVPSDAKFTDTTYSDVTTTAHGLMTATDKVKLNGIADGAEVNQNAYTSIWVGETSIVAENKTGSLTLEAGSNVTLTPDSDNHKVTITATDTTYSDATESVHGLMTASDKVILNKFTYDDLPHTLYVNTTTEFNKIVTVIGSNEVTDISPSCIQIMNGVGASTKQGLFTYDKLSIGGYISDKVEVLENDVQIINANGAIAVSLASLNTQVQGMLSKIYPVGCIYHSTSATNPGNASVFGFGTWVEIKITATWDTLKNGTTSYTDGATTGTVHTFRRTA